jgi:nicotinamidase-related amidase
MGRVLPLGAAALLVALGLSANAACDKAFVIVDVQRLYVEGGRWFTADGASIVAKIAPLLELARTSGVPVLYIQHVENPGVSVDSPLVGFPDAIAPREGEPVIQKRYASGFDQTTLQAELNARGIKTLFLTGLSSIACLNATLRSAQLLGYGVTVLADAQSAGGNARTAAMMNDVWKTLGATVVPSTGIDFASLCPSAEQAGNGCDRRQSIPQVKVEAPRTTSSRGRFREYARLQVEVINSLSRHLVEDLGFLESNFLVREGLLHGDRFTAYAGVAGLAEAV